jgi:hypothetical protein
VKLGHSAELISNKFVHLPRFREKVRILRVSLLDCAFVPGKPTLRVIESCIGFPRLEQFPVRLKEELAIPASQVIQSLSADRCHHQTSFRELLLEPALLHVVEIFKDLKPKLFRKTVSFLLELSDFLSGLLVVLKVVKKLVDRCDQMRCFFVFARLARLTKLFHRLDYKQSDN